MVVRIEADLLIPGHGEPIEPGTVVLEGKRIAYAGPAAAAPATPGAAVTEVAVLLPGLWECHAHFLGNTVVDVEAIAKEPAATRAARAVSDLRRLLDGGVTSVRELGGLGVFLQPAIGEGAIEGPTIYGSGGALSPTGGHGDIHGYPLSWVEFAENAGGALGTICDGVPDCLRAVREQLRAGARVIKVCASGGVMSEIDHPMHQQFSDEELRAIVAEAARAERVVAAHCHGKAGIMAALRAGAKTIEHGSYLDEEAAELMVERDAILVPTRFVVEELLTMEGMIPRYAYEKLTALADHHAEAMKIAVAAGVRIAAGTDIFVTGDRNGRNSREILHLMDAGLPALDAIAAATANGPLTLGPQGPHAGRLEEGFDADVIALDWNPIDNPSGWGDPQRITHVWKHGEPHKAPV